MSRSSSRRTACSAGSEGRRVSVRADDEIAGLVLHPRPLRLRCVEAGRGSNPQGELSDITHDADDLDLQRPAPIERQASTDGILRAEVDARPGFR